MLSRLELYVAKQLRLVIYIGDAKYHYGNDTIYSISSPKRWD